MLKGFNAELDAMLAKYSTGSSDDVGAGHKEGETQVTPATCDKVKQNVQKVFENEMSQALKQGMSQALSEFVVTPYQTLLDDYIDKTNMEAELCEERIERAIV